MSTLPLWDHDWLEQSNIRTYSRVRATGGTDKLAASCVGNIFVVSLIIDWTPLSSGLFSMF